MENEPEGASAAPRIECASCGESIASAAKVCRFCGYHVGSETLAAVPATAASKAAWLRYVGYGILCVVGVFILLFVIGMLQPHSQSQAKDNVRAISRDPDRVEFSGDSWWGSTGKTAIYCGQASFPNGFGGMSGPRRFLASDQPGGKAMIEGEGGEVAGLDMFETAYDAWCIKNRETS